MQNYRKELELLEKEVQDRKLEKAKIDERIKTLEEEKTKLLEELKEFGINSLKELEVYIQETEEVLNQKLTEARKILGLEN